MSSNMSFKNPAESDTKVFVFPPTEKKVMATLEAITPPSDILSAVEEEISVIRLPARKSFAERKHYVNLDKLEYPRKGSDPGKVLIFSQEFFDDKSLSYRKGTRRDVNEIIICMQRLGYNVTENDIFCDLTASQVLEELDRVVIDEEDRLKKCNSLILFFLTHGFYDEEIHTKDMPLKTSDIYGKFTNCKAVKKIPKMFIFQACKGLDHSTVAKDNTGDQGSRPTSKLIDFKRFMANPLGKNMLLVYATIEGNESYRNPLTGTWFIQELCKNFSNYGRRDDVLSLLIRTTKCVCKNYYGKEGNEIEKQMPAFVSTLTKKFYLNRNKDRDMLVHMEKKMENLENMVKEVLDILKKDKKVEGNHK